MDTDSFVINIKTEDFYKDIAGDVERWFDTSNYDEKDERPLSIGKNKKVIGIFKDELVGKIMTEFCALRAKAYAYKLDDDTEMKKAKGTKKCIVKREITFKNYADALFNDEVIIRSQQRFRSYNHKVYTEEVNKIALSSNDDKRIQTFDKVTTFPYETNHLKCVRVKCYQKINWMNLMKILILLKLKILIFVKLKILMILTEDKDEDIDNGRNKPVQVFEYIRRRRDKKKMVIGKKDSSSGSFGMMIIYQNHVKSGYIMMVTMHTQGLKSFTHVLVRWFLLENIKQPHQKINQTST